MPDGACIVTYEGKRGRVFRVKYRDADGRQVMETLGREGDGWNRRRAEKELRHRLADVEREGLRRAEPVTFQTLARDSSPPTRSPRGSSGPQGTATGRSSKTSSPRSAR
jgi:hypothetical protein